MKAVIYSSIILIVLPASSLQAQDSVKVNALKLSGSADMYYRYDFNNPGKSNQNNFTSFTNSQNSFELGMISFKAEQTFGKTGIVADIGFGKRADEFSYNDKGSGIAIKQLFFNYAPSSKIKLTLGSWATHIGYEQVDAYLNRNYSMSYLFSFGPFFHTGVKGEIAMGNKATFMVGLANPYDLKNAGNLPKMILAQIIKGSSDEKVKVSLNYMGGKNNDSSRLYQGDIVAWFSPSSKFGFTYNGTIQSIRVNTMGKWEHAKTWWGSALYFNFDPQEWLGFTLRTEYINDHENALRLNNEIFETTLSANFKIDNLVFIPEFRLENARRKMYVNAKEDRVNHMASFVLAATYHF